MKKQWLCVMLAVIMISMVGCGNPAVDAPSPAASTQSEPASGSASAADNLPEISNVDVSVPVTLKYYLIGDEQPDSREVWDEINTKLQADINTTIDPVIISWADYATRYPLIFASGEEFDMAWAGNWMDYAGIASKGGFMEITHDMLEKYTPGALAALPDSSFKQAMVDGKLYMVPFGEKTTNNIVIATRGDLKEKYGIGSINSLEDLERYCEAVVQNETGIIPIADVGPDNFALELALLYICNQWAYVDRTLGLAFDFTASDPKLFSVLETPEFFTFINKMNGFKEKGYLSRSALTYNASGNVEFKTGRGGVAFGNLNDIVALYQEVNNDHPEWKIEIENGSFGGKVTTEPAIVHGTTIHANSKNPERVLMAVELLNYREDYNHLVLYGFEGRHYQNINGAYEPLNADYVGTNYSSWASRGDFLLKPANTFATYDNLFSFFANNSIASPLTAFTLMTSDIRSEVAACSDIWRTKVSVLMYGAASDVQAGIDDALKTLKSAGYDDIIADANRQAAQYLEGYYQ